MKPFIVFPVYNPTDAELLLMLREQIRCPVHRRKVQEQATYQELQLMRIVLRFGRAGTGLKFRAIFEAWSVERIAQELCNL